jgi:hypothetical protein
VAVREVLLSDLLSTTRETTRSAFELGMSVNKTHTSLGMCYNIGSWKFGDENCTVSSLVM